jgi:DNA-directed RNA polymerase specialized sigma24 family protein
MASEKWTEEQIRELLPAIRDGIRGVVKNPDDVCDLVQDTLLKLFKAAANERPEIVSLSAYAWTAARNTAISFFDINRGWVVISCQWIRWLRV